MADFDEQPPLEQTFEEPAEIIPEVVEKYDNLTTEQQEEVKEIFAMFDKENNSTIEKGSLATLLRWLKFNPTEREL